MILLSQRQRALGETPRVSTPVPDLAQGVVGRTTEVSADRRERPAFDEQGKMSTNKICSDDRIHRA